LLANLDHGKYRILELSTRKVHISRHPTFIEDQFSARAIYAQSNNVNNIPNIELLTLELDFQVNVCLFTWSSAVYMVAIEFPSGGQGCNNIITNNSKLHKIVKIIKLIKVWWAYNIDGYISISIR
jgi:hypothetical protein